MAVHYLAEGNDDIRQISFRLIMILTNFTDWKNLHPKLKIIRRKNPKERQNQIKIWLSIFMKKKYALTIVSS